MQPVKITAVSYLNTKPLLYGLFKSPLADQIDLQLDIPSAGAEKLRNGTADLGLVPVAIIPELTNPTIISDYCIGTVGAVKTVCIYSHCPIHSIEEIYLDHHSRTSVELTQILLQHYWKIKPRTIQAKDGYIEAIQGTTAGLVIGDRTIGLEQRFPYVYDLGAIWQDFTGLPFVFAAWVTTKKLPFSFVNQFNIALQRGLAEIPQLIHLLPSAKDNFDLTTYFTKYISYDLDDRKKEALSLFLSYFKESVEVKYEFPASVVGG